MGSLHEGHISIVERAINDNAQTIITIYVNPTQFNDKNDFNKYPRNLEKDLDKLKRFKNIFIYAPKDVGKLQGIEFASTFAPVLSSLALSLASLNSINN